MSSKKIEPQLPAGVPADNVMPTDASAASFSVMPETASPRFDRSLPDQGPTFGSASERSVPRSDLMSKERQNITILIAVVALAMALAAVFRIANPSDPMPACSEQPDWNQFNCRAD